MGAGRVEPDVNFDGTLAAERLLDDSPGRHLDPDARAGRIKSPIEQQDHVLVARHSETRRIESGASDRDIVMILVVRAVAMRTRVVDRGLAAGRSIAAARKHHAEREQTLARAQHDGREAASGHHLDQEQRDEPDEEYGGRERRFGNLMSFDEQLFRDEVEKRSGPE